MNTNPESRRFNKRSMVCATFILIFFIMLLIRLMYLQLFEYHFYATLSKRNVISIVPVKPNRGLIYDRHGVLLAKNIPVYSLMVIPARVKNMRHTINGLTKLLQVTPSEIKNFYRVAKQYYPYQAVPLKQPLTENEVDHFYVNQYQFPGVVVQTNMIRNYSLGKTMSDVIGYVGRITASELAQVNPTNYTASDEIGKAGIESEDEVLLHGTMGSEEAEIDATGKVVRILKKTPAIAGDNIYLTIDSKLQAYAEKLLGKNSGAIVAIQPATGQVLALVTKPNYDPNMFVNGMTNAEYQAVMNAPDHPLINRATSALYAPGSTIKPFIALGALSNGIIDTQDYIFDPGWFRLPHTKHIFHNWVKKGFGWVNVTKAITVSCDTFFYQLATVMGIDRLDQALMQFGFGNVTGINLPLEKSGVVPSPQWKMQHIGQSWYEGDTVVAGIGQGYMLVTPLQLATATATMAEHGLKFQPTVLLKLQQPNGMITTMQPISENPIIAKHSSAWETVIQGMQNVISNPQGTAYPSFQNIAYTAAGKTGTAQLYDNHEKNNAQRNLPTRLLNDHLFICFAPINNPQIAIAIVVEHVAGMTQRGVLIARQLLDFYMNELKNSGYGNTNTNATLPVILPAPQNKIPAPINATEVEQDVQQEIKQDNANSAQNNNPASQQTPMPKIHSPYLDQLQQEMEMKVKTQMELEAESQMKHANTNNNF